MMRLTKKQKEGIIDFAAEEFDLNGAFCWEGYATIEDIDWRFRNDSAMAKIFISGSSVVEHQGDVSGIRDQVGELKDLGDKVVLIGRTYFGLSVLSADVDISDDLRFEDYDYEVSVSGHIILQVIKQQH